MHKGVELKDRIAGSPTALGIIGGLATAMVARALRRRERAPERDVRYADVWEEDEQPGRMDALKDRAAGKVEDVKHAAGDMKDRVVHAAHDVRERIPSAEQVKSKARQIGARGREYASEEPLITALGALAIGAALGFLLPLTDRERRVLGPTRQKVGEKLEAIASDVNEKVQAGTDELRERIVDRQPGI